MDVVVGLGFVRANFMYRAYFAVRQCGKVNEENEPLLPENMYDLAAIEVFQQIV